MVSTVASQQDISERWHQFCLFFSSYGLSSGLVSDMIQNMLWIPVFFTTALKYDINIPFNREVKHRAQIKLFLHILQPTQFQEMSSNVQKRSFTKTPLQACQTHLAITAQHTALAHLALACSALYAHLSAYTKQQHERATVSSSTTSQERGQRHNPSHHTGEEIGKNRFCINWAHCKYPLKEIPATTEEFVEL